MATFDFRLWIFWMAVGLTRAHAGLLRPGLSPVYWVGDCMPLLVLHSLRPEFRSLVTAALSELGGPDSPSDPLSCPSSQLEDKLPGKREPLPTPVCEGGSELLVLAMFGHAQLNLPQLLHLAAASSSAQEVTTLH